MPRVGLRDRRRSPASGRAVRGQGASGRGTDRATCRPDVRAVRGFTPAATGMVSEVQEKRTSPPAGEISRLAEHFFRHEAGKLVSVLTGIFGFDRLQLAEDVVQEALVRAL